MPPILPILAPTRSDTDIGTLQVYAATGYRPDGSDRVSDFRGVRVRELRLVRLL
jgi:hypothetical protein